LLATFTSGGALISEFAPAWNASFALGRRFGRPILGDEQCAPDSPTTPPRPINAFDPKSGAFSARCAMQPAKPFEIDDVWPFSRPRRRGGLETATPQLFFTAGNNNYGDGTFGVITSASKQVIAEAFQCAWPKRIFLSSGLRIFNRSHRAL